ncbi:MAG: YjjG family noncanonical pyrimidine nucleotidase [Vicinamibacteria bacterium]|nr:YjjG family noncanonical pyrimidine nucleotidase [Vicinamibacteria bacterium]
MKPVRAVIFDLDHTLFDTEKTERHALAEVSRTVGVPAGRRALHAYRAANTHVWAEYRAGRITSKELRVLRFHLWLERMDRDPASAKKLAPLYLDAFSSRGDLIGGAAAAVRAIGRLGLRLGVVTNGIDRVQRRRLKASALAGSFSVVVTSERAGFTKPDPRIMELALKRLRVRPEEAIYVGDDLQVDGLAANRASVPFVWFNPRSAPPAADIAVHYQVTNLSQLRNVL